MNEAATKALMEWVLPTPTLPTACAHGHYPEFCTISYQDRYGEAAVRYVSRKWWGLAVCCTGPTAYDEGQYARYKAAKAWNRMVANATG